MSLKMKELTDHYVQLFHPKIFIIKLKDLSIEENIGLNWIRKEIIVISSLNMSSKRKRIPDGLFSCSKQAKCVLLSCGKCKHHTCTLGGAGGSPSSITLQKEAERLVSEYQKGKTPKTPTKPHFGSPEALKNSSKTSGRTPKIMNRMGRQVYSRKSICG